MTQVTLINRAGAEGTQVDLVLITTPVPMDIAGTTIDDLVAGLKNASVEPSPNRGEIAVAFTDPLQLFYAASRLHVLLKEEESRIAQRVTNAWLAQTLA